VLGIRFLHFYGPVYWELNVQDPLARQNTVMKLFIEGDFEHPLHVVVRQGERAGEALLGHLDREGEDVLALGDGSSLFDHYLSLFFLAGPELEDLVHPLVD
jgi:hypothetical protein